MIDCLNTILTMTINKDELRARGAQEIDVGDFWTTLGARGKARSAEG
jgi:hypothetical protein